MRFSSSAPCKAILFGEHYVVYGSPALALAIEPRNAVEFSSWKGNGIALRSELGNGVIARSGRYDGPDDLAIFAEVAGKVLEKTDGAFPSCIAKFKPAWRLKGVGTSASLCAAFAAGLFRLGGKKAGGKMIFEAAQAGDTVAHGGKASGIDAKTVAYGRPLVFQRSFQPFAFNSKPAAFAIPKDASLLLIDTFVGKKDGTGKMLRLFASQFGIAGTPEGASEGQRKKIREEYAPLWERIAPAMKGASARELGSLMSQNHALLKRRKMSSAGIERAVSAALAAGAWGAKLTGGGGRGGAVLALVEKKRWRDVAGRVFSFTGFASHPLSIAKTGAR